MKLGRGETFGTVLAGGASRRFGSAKAFAELGGSMLIERVLAEQRAVVRRVWVVGSEPQLREQEVLFREHDVEVVPDVHVGRGPAAGVHAGLDRARAAGGGGVWITPCDAAFPDLRLGRALIAKAIDGVLAVLPESEGPLGYEPLFGWYSVAAADTFAELVEAAPVAMHEVVERLDRIVFLSTREISRFGDPRLLFRNVNTRSDLEEARRIVESPGGAR